MNEPFFPHAWRYRVTFLSRVMSALLIASAVASVSAIEIEPVKPIKPGQLISPGEIITTENFERCQAQFEGRTAACPTVPGMCFSGPFECTAPAPDPKCVAAAQSKLENCIAMGGPPRYR